MLINFDTCIPDDGLLQTQSYNGIQMTIDSNVSEDIGSVSLLIISFLDHYRVVNNLMNNIVVENVNQNVQFSIVAVWATFADTVKLSNFIFRNVTSTSHA